MEGSKKWDWPSRDPWNKKTLFWKSCDTVCSPTISAAPPAPVSSWFFPKQKSKKEKKEGRKTNHARLSIHHRLLDRAIFRSAPRRRTNNHIVATRSMQRPHGRPDGMRRPLSASPYQYRRIQLRSSSTRRCGSQADLHLHRPHARTDGREPADRKGHGPRWMRQFALLAPVHLLWLWKLSGIGLSATNVLALLTCREWSKSPQMWGEMHRRNRSGYSELLQCQRLWDGERAPPSVTNGPSNAKRWCSSRILITAPLMYRRIISSSTTDRMLAVLLIHAKTCMPQQYRSIFVPLLALSIVSFLFIARFCRSSAFVLIFPQGFGALADIFKVGPRNGDCLSTCLNGPQYVI